MMLINKKNKNYVIVYTAATGTCGEDLKCLFFINQFKEKILYYNNNE